MSVVVCPKCQFRQQEASECLRCGLIFDRYRPDEERPAQGAPSGQNRVRPPVSAMPAWTQPKVSPLRRTFRILRWTSLGMAALALGLIFLGSPAPVVETDPEAGRRVQEKLRETQAALQSGKPHSLRLNEAEVNSWLEQSLQTVESSAPDVGAMIGREASAEEVRHAAENLKMQLEGDEVKAYLTFDFHGTELSLSVQGRILAENGFLKLQPSSGSLGSLPIPQAALRRAVDRVFSSPENRDKLRLPDNVRDIGIQNGEVVVTYQ